MYATVPTTAPTCVSGPRVSRSGAPGARLSSPESFAIPKSTTFTYPSRRTMTFSGLMSRCTMPAPCAASRAAAVWVPMSAISNAVSEPMVMRERSVSPSTISVAMNR